jgi:hypothetical protein
MAQCKLGRSAMEVTQPAAHAASDVLQYLLRLCL